MHRLVAGLLAIALPAACVRSEVSVQSSFVLEHDRWEATPAGRTDVVETDAGDHRTLHLGDQVEIVDLTGAHELITVGALLDRCASSTRSCDASLARIVVGHDRRLSSATKTARVVAAAAAALGGLAYCVAECGSPGDAIAGGGLGLAVAGALIFVATGLGSYAALAPPADPPR